MRLIKPSYEIIEQGPGLQGVYDIIEKCGKVSYKSEPKGGETAKRFVEARAKEGHGAVLEFGTVYLKIHLTEELEQDIIPIVSFYSWNKYSKCIDIDLDEGMGYDFYITTNYRVLVENGRLDDLKFWCEPTKYHERRYAVKFITDIGLGRDFLRHRVMSMVQESTRYVNYNKEKFGEQLTFVIPPWIDLPECEDLAYWDGDWVDMKNMKIVCPEGKTRACAWLWALDFAEKQYMVLTNDWSHIDGVPEEEKAPWQAQQARTVLPMSTKTEFVLSGIKDAWIHFFCLRSDIAATGKAHPMSIQLANPLRDEFIERQYITEEGLKNETEKILLAELERRKGND